MLIVMSAHFWARYEQRMRAHVPPEQLEAFAAAALELGEPIPMKGTEPDVYCRMYRRFALIFRETTDGAALLTVLPRGTRPNTERTIRIPKA